MYFEVTPLSATSMATVSGDPPSFCFSGRSAGVAVLRFGWLFGIILCAKGGFLPEGGDDDLVLRFPCIE